MRLAIWLSVCVAPLCAQAHDPASKSQRGKELMAAGKFEEAIPVYRDLVRTLPNHPGPIMNLGLALHMSGHEREALTQFQAVLKLEPTHLPARLFLGAAYLGLKEPAKAIEPLRTVIRDEPDNKEARLVLGQALLSLERFEPAAKHFLKLSELDPGNPKVWNGLGLSYEGLASRNFGELEKVALGSAYWFVLVAEAQAKADRYKSAFYFYREALPKMPPTRGIHAAVAEIYRKTEHPDWAAIEEEKERKLPPLHCGISSEASVARPPQRSHSKEFQRLECEFRAGRYEELIAKAKVAKTPESFYWLTRSYNELARRAFSHLAQLPSSAEVHELIAKIHFSRKNYPLAAKEWQEALEFSPGNRHYQLQLAISLSTGRNYEASEQLLEDLVKRSPDSFELNYWLGFTLIGLVKPAEAIPFLEKAVETDPTVLEAHRDLARAYIQLGQAEKAVPHLKAALPIDKDGSLYYQLARAYRSMGQAELEKEMLKKFREIENLTSAEKRTLEKQMDITPP